LTVEKEKYPEIAEQVDKLTVESVITVEGMVVENSFVKMGGVEMLPEKMHIESIAEPLPISKDAAIDSRLDYRWVDLRSDRNTLIFKAQTCMVGAMREFCLQKNFMEIHTPKLIGAASESGSDVFELKYFDRKAYLSQSPQFYKQMAMAAGFDRIFEVGPVFRAEKSFTNKHATEFTGFDIEMSYITSFREVMEMEAEILQYALQKVKDQYGEQIKEIFGLEVVVPTLPFPEMKLQDVYKELEERYGYTCPEEEKNDLTTEAEHLCAKLSMDKFGHEFLFVTDYGPEKRAFYHMRDEHGMPLGYDLIWRGTEITTGAQREHRYEQLRAQADEKGLGEDVKFYMDFFRYGCPPHGGFGLGVDRLTMLLVGVPIKEVMFLFRGPNRLTP
ncbi:MAG: aspartate--tRNA(Asn) ligase, partial [Clostridia bacterium]|nr:aspartate--tRNA(Asn) ligase [Clostridia bacterium]